jgi:hypothetical protein
MSGQFNSPAAFTLTLTGQEDGWTSEMFARCNKDRKIRQYRPRSHVFECSLDHKSSPYREPDESVERLSKFEALCNISKHAVFYGEEW